MGHCCTGFCTLKNRGERLYKSFTSSLPHITAILIFGSNSSIFLKPFYLKNIARSRSSLVLFITLFLNIIQITSNELLIMNKILSNPYWKSVIVISGLIGSILLFRIIPNQDIKTVLGIGGLLLVSYSLYKRK